MIGSLENILNLTYEELINFLEFNNYPAYRAKQIYNWIYKRRNFNPQDFSDLPKNLRAQLKPILKLTLKLRHIYNSQDKSSKFVFETQDSEYLETVLMRHVRHSDKRYTVCISTQLGCPIGCKFCASGKVFKRSLDTGEMVQQLLLVQKYLDETEKVRISNVVLMGMGEPLLNYHNLIKFIKIITHDAGLNISSRSITVSTVGIPDRIIALAHDAPRVRLAISLHAVNDELRAELIPIAKRYKIREILSAAKIYRKLTKRRVTIEYLLIKDVNDSLEHAKQLLKLVKDLKPLVNLIPYNPVPGVNFSSPPPWRVRAFERFLRPHLEVSVRYSLGSDINAACGQLSLKLSGQISL